MNTTKQSATVRSYLDNLATRRFGELGALLGSEFAFRTPGVEVPNSEAFVGMLKEHLGPVIEGVDIKHIFSDGDEAAAFFELITKGGRVTMAERFQPEAGKIKSIHLIYDPAEMGATAG